MKDLGTILILGGLALGAWCFLMGPCKGWLKPTLASAPPSPTTGIVGGKKVDAGELLENSSIVQSFREWGGKKW